MLDVHEVVSSGSIYDTGIWADGLLYEHDIAIAVYLEN